jgi:hypothetical protein
MRQDFSVCAINECKANRKGTRLGLLQGGEAVSDHEVKAVFVAAFVVGAIAGVLIAVCGACLSAYVRKDEP